MGPAPSSLVEPFIGSLGLVPKSGLKSSEVARPALGLALGSLVEPFVGSLGPTTTSSPGPLSRLAPWLLVEAASKQSMLSPKPYIDSSPGSLVLGMEPFVREDPYPQLPLARSGLGVGEDLPCQPSDIVERMSWHEQMTRDPLVAWGGAVVDAPQVIMLSSSSIDLSTG